MSPKKFWRAVLFAAFTAPCVTASADDTSLAFVSQSSNKDPLASLATANGWLNSPPLRAEALRGKVVLVDFWTYSCINWLRSFPYVRAWAAKYKDQGLVVIGVHSPEFRFEHEFENVRRATRQMGVEYPVAIDNDFAIWRAFGNEFWPALYFIDAKGRIRHHKFGEGDYEQSEKMIRKLLAEAGSARGGRDAAPVDARGFEVAADWRNLKSGENYLGYQRTENFASPEAIAAGKRFAYSAPAQIKLNEWALVGAWVAQEQLIASKEPHARIVYRFHARDLHLVMGPSATGEAVRFQIRIDGQAPGADHGIDVDERGFGTVTEPRLYQLVRQRGSIDDRLFEIEFLNPGVEAYSFTFG